MSEPIRVDKEVTVLGGTLEAGRVSRELLQLGYTVHWVSSTSNPWENGLDHPQLSTYQHCSLVRLDGHVGGFVVILDRGGDRFSVKTSALVVASGNERYFPADRYALPLSPNVLTASQLRSQLDAPRDTKAALPSCDQGVILFLDLGGATARETAAETLDLATCLRKEWHCEVFVFYRDLKVDSPGFERLTREMRESGVIFCRYESPEIVANDGGISVSYGEGTLHGGVLVLPESVRPRGDTESLADLLGVSVGEDGYFTDVNIHQLRSGISNRRGIFFAGRCYMDCDIQDAEADALQAAANVDALLGSGLLEPEEVIAHVDSSKCIRCLTCVRSCPHAAIEITAYEQVEAARVVDLACRGCGACVTNCPVQAIELLGQAMPAWMQGI